MGMEFVDVALINAGAELRWRYIAMALEEAAEMAGTLIVLAAISMAVRFAQADGSFTVSFLKADGVGHLRGGHQPQPRPPARLDGNALTDQIEDTPATVFGTEPTDPTDADMRARTGSADTCTARSHRDKGADSDRRCRDHRARVCRPAARRGGDPGRHVGARLRRQRRAWSTRSTPAGPTSTTSPTPTSPRCVGAGFRATTDETEIGPRPTAVICVPTPLSDDGGPDLGAVTVGRAARSARHLRPGMLVVLESTTYPGTTDEVVRPILEESGLIAGSDFHLAFSPERIDPGNEQFGARNTPKVVGGHTPDCTDRAATFYGRFVDTVVRTKGTREAETAKLLENTYRHVNIALVNEMARFCHELGIDLWDVIRAASQQAVRLPGRSTPAPASAATASRSTRTTSATTSARKLGYPFRFVELAQEINATMPGVRGAAGAEHPQRRRQGHQRRAPCCCSASPTSPNIADQRESPAVPLARQLHRARREAELPRPVRRRTGTSPGVDVTRVDDLETPSPRPTW